MKMKIVPIVCESGHRYVVVRDSFLCGRRYLTQDKFLTDSIASVVGIASFTSIKEAVEKIREIFGTSAIIERWEGK